MAAALGARIAAADIQFVGILEDIGAGWRTPSVGKPLDPEGDNVLGTDGYHLVNLPPVWPSYVASTEVLTTTFSGNNGFYSIDRPDGAAGVFLTGTLNPYPGVGVTTDLLKFRLSSTAVGRAIRVALLVDNLDDPGFNSDALSIVQTAGGSGAAGPFQTDMATLNNRTPDWVIFEITGGKAGDEFTIRGTGGSLSTATLGGVAFDSAVRFSPSLDYREFGTLSADQIFAGSSSFAGIAVSGDTAVVGNPIGNEVAVLVRDGVSWSRQAILRPHNPGADLFGWQVSISGNTIAVGAPNESSIARVINSTLGDDNSRPNSGAVYVFVRNGTNWVQQAYLKSDDSEADGRFGGSVSLFGDTVVVGTGLIRWLDSMSDLSPGVLFGSKANGGVGAAYAFVRSGTNWTQQARLAPRNGDPGDGFGLSLSFAEDTVVIGAPFEGGASSDINGDESSNASPGAGAAYVFTRKGSVWSQEAYLKSRNNDPGNPSPGNLGDRFGWQVALSGNTALIGAPMEDSLGLTPNNWGANNGAAYIFVRSQGQWSQQAMLKGSALGGAAFGASLSLSGDTAAVSELFGGGPMQGVPVVFRRQGTSWIRSTSLPISEPRAATIPVTGYTLSGGMALVRKFPNLYLLGTDVPRLRLQDSAGIELSQPSSQRTMAIQDGQPEELVLTLENVGSASLSNIVATLAGPNANRFSLIRAPETSLAPGAKTTVSLRFIDATGSTPLQATLRIASSDSAHDPSLVNLTGVSLLSSLDTDGDGMSDAAEHRLAAFGFDPWVRQTTLVKALNNAGLISPAQIHAIAAGKPVLEPISPGRFRLKLGLQKATQLTNFVPFPILPPQATINPQGQLEYEFSSPDSAGFFLLNLE